jgi:uncharacterized RDD family membrane protein YckC
MKSIEITTTQNVTVHYTLANPGERAIALALDIMAMGVVFLILLWIQSFLFPNSKNLMFYFTLYPFLVFYSLAFEQLNNGQSLGKMIVKLRVIRMDGEQTSFFDYLMRWIFRSIDIYSSLGGVAVLSILSSNYNQRLGDLLANTVVVNIGKSDRMALGSLLKLGKIDNYKITYPQVIKLSEETMLIVKETLSKKIKMENEAHDEALNLLVKKMVKELGVKTPKDKDKFLTTLLKDYIILTR